MKVFEAFVGAIWVAFDVVIHVAWVWFGKQVEAAEVFERKQKLKFG